MLIHAAGESSPGNISPHTFAIALVAPDERHLEEISWCLTRDGIAHRRILETDAPWTGQLMAVGIPPQERRRIRKLPCISSLPGFGRGWTKEDKTEGR